MIRETSTSGSGESFLGWANSNPIGCTFVDNNSVDFMIFRNIGSNDYKGVNERFYDTHVTSTAFQFYIEKSVNGALFHKVRANAKINEPYFIYDQTLNINACT